jgi:hypothetical protein
LTSRVDWLTAAFKVELDTAELSALENRLVEQERAAVEIGGVSFELRRMRSGKRLLARNGDLAIVIDPEGPEGWTVQLDAPGSYMMRADVDAVVGEMRGLARALGGIKGERLRRLDMCADVAGRGFV